MSHSEDAAVDGLADQAAVLAAEAHRLANVLQIIASVLAYRRRHLDDPVARAEIEWAEQVVQSLLPHTQRAAIHEGIAFSELLAQQVARWRQIYAARLIDLAFEADAVRVPEDRRMTLTLAVNELLTNALKHAFPDPDREGTVQVALRRVNGGAAELSVSDNGVGLADDRAGGTGLRLLERLARQLGGTVHIDGSAGTTVRLRFPV